MKFEVSKYFFDKVEDAVFGVVVVKNFNNKVSYNYINNMFNESLKTSKEKFLNVKIKEEDWIQPYREAFRKLNINPNKYMCSIEALITRISKGNDIPNINSIVDLGNALSLKYELPIGVHDMDNSIDGDIQIRESDGNDNFVPFGSDEIEHPDAGEIIYASGNEVKTRRWTWRQGEKSKVTEESKDFFIPIDGFTSNKDKILELQEELVKYLKDDLKLEVYSGIVDKDNRIFEIEA